MVALDPGVDTVANYEQLRKDRDWSVDAMVDYLNTIDPALAERYKADHGKALDEPAVLKVSIEAATSDPSTDARDTAIVAEVGTGENGINPGSGPTPDAVGTGAVAPAQTRRRGQGRKRTAEQPEKDNADQTRDA